MRLGARDIAAWLYRLKEKGINEFRYRDLPQELQIKRMILGARISGLISKIENNKIEKSATWRITKDGHILADLYGK